VAFRDGAAVFRRSEAKRLAMKSSGMMVCGTPRARACSAAKGISRALCFEP
jgi:hypothetical protein